MPTLTYSIFFRCVKKNLSYTNKDHQLCLCALVYNPPPELQVVPAVKNPSADAGGTRYTGLIPGQGRSPWRRKWQPTPVFLPGKSYGQRSLVGYNPWGPKEPHTAMWLDAHSPPAQKTRLLGWPRWTLLLTSCPKEPQSWMESVQSLSWRILNRTIKALVSPLHSSHFWLKDLPDVSGELTSLTSTYPVRMQVDRKGAGIDRYMPLYLRQMMRASLVA